MVILLSILILIISGKVSADDVMVSENIYRTTKTVSEDVDMNKLQVELDRAKANSNADTVKNQAKITEIQAQIDRGINTGATVNQQIVDQMKLNPRRRFNP